MSQQSCASIPQRKGTPDEQRKQLSVCKACGSKMIFRQVASNKVLVFCSSKKVLALHYYFHLINSLVL